MIPFTNGNTADVIDFPVGSTVALSTPWTETGTTHFTIDNDIVAVIFDRDGEVNDLATNIDTAITRVNGGALALALRGSTHPDTDDTTNHYSIDDYQAALDAEANAYADCFGLN